MKTANLLTELNEVYGPLSPIERLNRLSADFSSILVSSSFGTSSAVLLHYLSQSRLEVPVHFIDTGFLFEETHAYRRMLEQRWNLEVIALRPDAAGHAYAVKERLWENEPDVCCGINKTMTIEEVRDGYEVWVAGLMSYQNANRSQMNIWEEKGGTLRCYPLLDLTAEEVEALYAIHDLPRHPLQAKGYGSVGCTHCTVRGEGRQGRWMGSFKTECGLHA